jgi:hypothetical protein
MKYLALLILFINTVLHATTYIGVGNGATEQEAKQNALKDISDQISIKIDNQTKLNKKLVDGKYSKNIITSSTQSSKANIVGYELLSMNFENRIYKVKIKYENIPSLDKFAKKTKYTKQQILKSIQKDFGKSLGLELVRKDKRWYIKYKNIMQVLDSKDFSHFFKTTINDDLSVSTNKKNNILYEDDEFYFEVKSSKSGYVSILTVYEDGTVSVLMKNIKIQKNITTSIPDKEFEAIPIAGLMTKGKDTFDMYIAIYSQKKIILDNFALADENMINDEKYKNLDQLLYFFDDYSYTTLRVITKPRI